MKLIVLFEFSLFLCSRAFAQIPIPVPGWPHASATGGYVEYAVTRFGLDGEQLSLLYNMIDGRVAKFSLNGAFSQGWPAFFDTLIFQKTPIVLDFDHDEQAEMLALAKIRNASNLYDLLFLFDDNGSVIPGFPLRNLLTYAFNAVDLDGDNEYEIIFFDARSDLIHCIDRNGSPKPGWPVNFHMPRSEYSLTGGVAIGDLDLDGNNEYLLSGFREIYAFRSDGSTQQGFPIHLQEDSLYSYAYSGAPPALADLDGDGYPEILFCGDNWSPLNPTNFRSFVVVYEHNGIVKEGWPRYLERCIVMNDPTPGDINHDDLLEIGFQYGESLTFVDANFNALPGWPVRLLSPDGQVRGSNSDLIIVDIDGDGDCEIFTDYNAFFADSMGQDSLWYYGHSYLFALDHTGQNLSGYPIEVGGVYFRLPPTFGLEPSTNMLYMGLATDFLMPAWMDTIFLQLYLFPDSTGPPDQWPMLSHDNLMTRNYSFVDRVTSIADEGSPPLPKSAILKQNYPNPFNYSTLIEFSLPREEHFTLSLYDILGRKVVNLYDDTYPAGKYKHRLDMDIPSGIYFYSLKAGETQITRKMILLK